AEPSAGRRLRAGRRRDRSGHRERSVWEGEVSGGIKAFPRDPRYGATPDGRVFRIERARFGKPVPYELAQTVGRKGYLYVGNGSHRGLQTTAVHRVIAETFIPNPEALPEVAHCNGVNTDNRADNLRWSTAAANQADRLTHGTHNRGTRQGQ